MVSVITVYPDYGQVGEGSAANLLLVIVSAVLIFLAIYIARGVYQRIKSRQAKRG